MPSHQSKNKLVRQNRLRQAALRQGLKLKKSRRHDPMARDYDGFMFLDLATEEPIAGHEPYHYSLTIDEVEELLNSGKLVRRKV